MAEYASCIEVAGYLLTEQPDLSNISSAKLHIIYYHAGKREFIATHACDIRGYGTAMALPQPNMTLKLHVDDGRSFQQDMDTQTVNRTGGQVQLEIKGRVGAKEVEFFSEDLMVTDVDQLTGNISVIIGGVEGQRSTRNEVLLEFKEINDPSIKRFRNILED